jgi:DUF1365 family protein
MHRRLHPKPHEFVYRIFLFLLDLDEIPALTRAVPIFSADFLSTTKALRKPFEKPIIKQARSARLAMGSARKS